MRFVGYSCVLLSALALSLLFYAVAEAFFCRPGLIPNGGINECENCHLREEGGGPRNPFGSTVDGVAVGCNPFWGPGIAGVDSDGDGRTNGEELGDPEGTWQAGDPPPGDPALVTLPGKADGPPPGTAFVRGDVNSDGTTDLSDSIAILDFFFHGGPAPACAASADANAEGATDLSDAVYLLQYLFLGTAAPAAPFPDCGSSPNEEACEAYPPCG